jgi:hypothetical protein
MARTPEGKVKDAVRRVLNDLDIYYFMPATGGYGRSGVPDFVCCLQGRFLAIECKAGKNTTTALQQREIEKISKARGNVVIINEGNISLLAGTLKKIKEALK